MKQLIYQVLPRYWGSYKGANVRSGVLSENGCGHFADIDGASLDYIKSLGCDYVWYTGVIRHSTKCNTAGCAPSHPSIVKGQAGSPYSIYDYYDVNPYLALRPERRMDEFRDLVRRTHEKGLKLLLDFVPNHVSRDNVNFGRDDDKSVHFSPSNDFFYYPGEALALPGTFTPTEAFPEPYTEFPAKATGNDCYNSHPGINDWYETIKLNYCNYHTPTWDKMLDILLHWAGMGVDGFRCDMVELVPVEFFKWLIAKVKESYPGLIFVAEVYKKDLYRSYIDAGFDILYDKSGMYDSLHDIIKYNLCPEAALLPWQSCKRLTSDWQFLGDMQPRMLCFLENHDELRIASKQFAASVSNTYAALAYALLFNDAPFMLYFGEEVGEDGSYEEGYSGKDGRSSIFDWWRIESVQRLWTYIHTGKGLTKQERSVLKEYRALLKLAGKSVFRSGRNYDLRWCNCSGTGFDPDRHSAFLRYDSKDIYLIFCNFSDKEAFCTLEIPIFELGKVDVQAPAFGYKAMRLKF